MEFHTFHRVAKAFWLCFLVSTLNTVSNSFVEGSQKIPKKYRGLKHKGTVKTIVDPEDNVVIDCVDFYQQPAFDDPLFNRSQVNPSYIPGETKITNEDLQKSGLYQNWRKYGECPTGTIPIRRIRNRESHRKRMQKSNGMFANHEYAVVKHSHGKYFGGRADLNVWQPRTELREISITQIWAASGYDQPQKLNTIEAGWIVNPRKYNDSKPVTFIFWTADGYIKTGCYNLDCPGFLQTFAGYTLEVPIGPSSYNDSDELYDISVELNLLQNGPEKNWFLKLNGQQIGYWPGHIFDTLLNGAETVHWGGEITNKKQAGHHTTTEMGNGHFADEGYTRASCVKKLAIMYNQEYWVDVDESDLATQTTHRTCYNVIIPPPTDELGTHFFYGGPGYSDKCEF